MKRPYLFNILCLGVFVFASCTPKKAQELLDPINAMGVVLAEKTAELAGAKKDIVIIAPDSSWGPMSTAEEAFRSALKKQDLKVVDTKNVNLGDPMKSGAVGLRSADFFDAMAKNPTAGAIVSFAGAPLFQASDASKLAASHPPVLVVAIAQLGTTPGIPGNRETLTNIVEANWVQWAVIDGSGNISSKDAKPNATHQSFDQNFAVLTPSKQ